MSETKSVFTSPDDYYPRVYPLPTCRLLGGFMATDEQKWRVLATIGVTPETHSPNGENPLSAWRNAVADLNGVDRDSFNPEHGGTLDLGFSRTPVRQFVFYLA